MPESQFRARQVSAKTQEVVDYHRDDARPGKPLFIMIPGALLALAALGLIIYIAYRTWLVADMDQNTGLTLILLLAPFYIGSVFLFSYGYELYNIPRALRLTAIIVFTTLASVVIVAVVFLLIGGSGGKSKSSSNSSGKGGSASMRSMSSGSTTRHVVSSGGPIFIGGGSGPTRVETREVEKRVEVPVAPRSIDCPFCGRSYVPSENKYACPACGAATPKELIDASEAPQDSTSG